MTGPTPTLWTTLRDFGAVVVACIIGAVALFALINKAHAESAPPYPPRGGYEEGYDREPAPAWIACRPDVHRYCSDVLPGGGRVLSCLAGNKDRLSYGCRDALLRAQSYFWGR